MKARFRLEIAALAEADLRELRAYIARDKKTAAAKWLRQVVAAIHTLRFFPHSHEQIPEADELGLNYRHVIHGNYRIIYRVEERRVRVLRVVHGGCIIQKRMLDDQPP